MICQAQCLHIFMSPTTVNRYNRRNLTLVHLRRDGTKPGSSKEVHAGRGGTGTKSNVQRPGNAGHGRKGGDGAGVSQFRGQPAAGCGGGGTALFATLDGESMELADWVYGGDKGGMGQIAAIKDGTVSEIFPEMARIDACTVVPRI